MSATFDMPWMPLYLAAEQTGALPELRRLLPIHLETNGTMHLALEKVLACPDVDFLTSPTSYAFRQFGGEGTSHFMSLLGSIKLHGKLWFNENDVRTSLAPGQVGEWGRPARRVVLPNRAGDRLP